mmetsp:Transcript_8172/g.13463  ORF Transcript_8172/g.13463 Transcript_8172/m.13463 type:complete len:147 (-) Transcript_8172:52-492(-)
MAWCYLVSPRFGLDYLHLVPDCLYLLQIHRESLGFHFELALGSGQSVQFPYWPYLLHGFRDLVLLAHETVPDFVAVFVLGFATVLVSVFVLEFFLDLDFDCFLAYLSQVLLAALGALPAGQMLRPQLRLCLYASHVSCRTVPWPRL